MSTRSAVIVKIGDTYNGIYCHYDGYTEGVGKTLKENFNNEAQAKEIVDLGDCSIIDLCVRIKPSSDSSHSFEKPEDGTIIAYHRDRGEEWETVKPKTGSTWQEVADKIGHNGYVYVWENDQWNFNEC